MGWTIGMPSLKLNKAGLKSKHCGDFQSVAAEALKERNGHDPDIDPERAAKNIYEGFETAADLLAYSDEHCSSLRDANGRALRKDAVRMCATIFKPPAALMATMSEEDQKIFLQDGVDKIEEIVGKENVKAKAWHFDEQGAHVHVFWEPMTDDGRLCAKELHGLQFFGRLNKEMPEHLRSKGWDIDDCNAYDMAAEELKTEKEKAERRQKNGRSSAAFKADAERQLNEINLQIDKTLIEMEGEIERRVQEQIDLVTGDDRGVYDGGLFYLANCDDDEFRDISKKGLGLMREFLQEEAADLQISKSLDQIIADIESGKARPQLTWQERQEKWEAYNSQVSAPFWEMRSELKADYAAGLDDAYKKRRQARHVYYDAIYMLRESRGLISALIAFITALAAQHELKKYEQQIKELRNKRDVLVRNTANFTKFSRAYREDLKAGRFPGTQYMEAMAKIVKSLDQEHQQFRSKDRPQLQHGHDPRFLFGPDDR